MILDPTSIRIMQSPLCTCTHLPPLLVPVAQAVALILGCALVAGQSSYPWPGIVIGVVVLLVLVLVFAGIAWFVLSR